MTVNNQISKAELYDYLEFNYEKFNHPNFIIDDPISIPHLFTKKKDIESIGFIMATISWGNRKSIINNGHKLVDIMGNQPHDYIMNASEEDLLDLQFVHRTYNADDLRFFILALRNLYTQFNGSLEGAFLQDEQMANRISKFRTSFLETAHEKRSEKHISNPLSGSASKRINMFLRWMVRQDNKGVDFGIWNRIKPSELLIPLDVHTGNVARKLGLINRKQNDWKALEELMENLREFDAVDPCKYDYSLFGLGVTGEL